MFFAALCVFSSKSVAQNAPTPAPQKQSGSVVSDSIKKEGDRVKKVETKSTNTLDNNRLPTQAAKKSTNAEEAIPFALVETKPKFQGEDQNAFSRWVNKQIRYPETAMKAGEQGKVMIQFMVDAKGNVKDVEVSKSSTHSSLDAEAMRVVKSSPAWTPGRQKNKPVDVMLQFPVNFSLK